MNYMQHVNAMLRNSVAAVPELVIFGQNVSAGSCIGGLTRGLTVTPGSRILNTQNSEGTLAGVGFGLMLRGVSSVLCLKQQDFLLLSLDHLVNTYNVVRRLKSDTASFTILLVVVDQGFDGPQSCLNNLDDFCSMAHVPGYVMHNGHDVEKIINTHLVAPGFRILCVSQRLAGTELLRLEGPVETTPDGAVFRYARGTEATVVACNFAFPQALAVWNHLQDHAVQASLFSVNAMDATEWHWIREDLQRTRKLVLLDDSKSGNRMSDRLLWAMREAGVVDRAVLHRRDFSPAWFRPNPDLLEVDPAEILRQLQS
ncbi:MAG: hypothetical protein H7838_06020 [Magnetococcus sp. DMHC-8]